MRLHLNVKNIDGDEQIARSQISQIKSQFLAEVKKPRIFLNKSIIYASYNISEDACWEKFAIGEISNHRTNKISINRIKRLHWIPILIDYIVNNNYVSPDPDISYSVKREEHTIYVSSKKYKLVLRELKKYMLVITAYPLNK